MTQFSLLKILNKIRNLFKIKSAEIDKTTVLHRSAKIINLLGDATAIKIGAFTHIRGEFFTFAHGGEIKIGDYCYIGENSKIWSAKRILIGNRVLIAHNVNIFDNNTHPINHKARHKHYKQIITTGFPKNMNNNDLKERSVIINNDVWVGCMSIILPGVTIGEGVIICAGSVVTKNIPPWTMVAGNPARVVKEIPPEER